MLLVGHPNAIAHFFASELIAAVRVLGLSSMPVKTEFDALVRGEPIFELAEVNIDVHRSAIGSLFGRRFAAKQLARQLANAIGPVLDQGLVTYGGLLRSWVMSVLNQLKRAFDVYADSYRADTERTLAGTAPAADEMERIRRDLDLLAADTKIASSKVDRSQDARAKSFSRAATGRFVEGE